MDNAAPPPLMSPADLAASLAAGAPPTVLDVRWRLGGPPGRLAYDDTHVPGAVFLDLDADLAGPPGAGGRHPLPSAERLQAVLRAAGVRRNHPVVVYDDRDGSVAARAWWLLRWAGHEPVRVLDGGFARWHADGLPVTAEVPAPPPGDLVVRPGHLPVLDAAEAAALASGDTGGVLLDARAPERYRGDVEPVDPRAGHIPGARNAPFAGHTDADGHWKPAAELAERFAALGVTPGAPVGAYCGSGVTAASVVLALEVAGMPSAALYAGSWSHWCTDATRPVATGDAPN